MKDLNLIGILIGILIILGIYKVDNLIISVPSIPTIQIEEVVPSTDSIYVTDLRRTLESFRLSRYDTTIIFPLEGIVAVICLETSYGTVHDNYYDFLRIHCTDRKCDKEHIGEMFYYHKVIYPWDRYEEFIKLLMSNRYKYTLEIKDPYTWTTMLHRAGYATDLNYSKKLHEIIQINSNY